jgi:hypothetical protein
MPQNGSYGEDHPHLRVYNIYFIVISVILVFISLSTLGNGSGTGGWFVLLGILGITSYIFTNAKSNNFTNVDNAPWYVRLLCYLNAILGFVYGFLVIYIIKCIFFALRENS